MPITRSSAARNVPLVVGGALIGAQLARTLRSRLSPAGRQADAPVAADSGMPKGRRGRPDHLVDATQGADARAGSVAAGRVTTDEAAPGDLLIRAPLHGPTGKPVDLPDGADAEPPPVDPAEMAVISGIIPSEPVSQEELALQSALAHAQEEGWPEAAPAHASRGGFAIAKEAVMAWLADGGLRLGASIAFYTIFAIAPMMLVLLAIAGAVFGEEAARGQIMQQLGGLVGTDSANTIQQIVEAASHKNKQGAFSTIIGLGTALVGASAVFVELKNAFDTIFKPQPAEEGSAITALVRARLMSVALVLAIAFLVVVSLLLSAAATAFSQWVGLIMPFLKPVLGLLDVLVSTVVLTVAFWALIRFLPQRAPKPRAVWIGALTSAVLFSIGKRLIGLYLTYASVASAYGAAGSFIVVVMWVYYSSQILLLGAEVARAIDDPAQSARKANEGREMAAAAGGQ